MKMKLVRVTKKDAEDLWSLEKAIDSFSEKCQLAESNLNKIIKTVRSQDISAEDAKKLFDELKDQKGHLNALNNAFDNALSALKGLK